MRAMTLPAVVVLLLAGCAAPLDDTTEPLRPALPRSGDIDLHDFVLNMTMPEGQPTMLVALNVTKDMWVRPFLGSPDGFQYRKQPATVPNYWLLCPWVRSLGLADDMHYVVFPLWLNGRDLTRATNQFPEYVRGDEDGGKCATTDVWNFRDFAIASDEPHDGTLVLVFAARLDSMDFPRPSGEPASAPFQLLLGIAREICTADPTNYCPPVDHAQAEPLLRGGKPMHARYSEYDGPCDACGFLIQDDRRPGLAGIGEGRVTFTRGSTVAPSLIYVSAGSGIRDDPPSAPGSSSVEIVFEADGATTRLSCTDAGANQGVGILGSTAGIGKFSATFDLTGTRNIGVAMLEVPLDLAKIGWRLPPGRALQYSGLLWATSGSGNPCG